MILPTHVCRHFRGHRHLPTCRHCQQKFADRPQSAADSLYSLMPYKPPSGSDSIHWFSFINVDYCRAAHACALQPNIANMTHVILSFIDSCPLLLSPPTAYLPVGLSPPVPFARHYNPLMWRSTLLSLPHPSCRYVPHSLFHLTKVSWFNILVSCMPTLGLFWLSTQRCIISIHIFRTSSFPFSLQQHPKETIMRIILL